MKYIIFLLFVFQGFITWADCTQPAFCNRSCWDPNGDHPAQTSPTPTTPTHITVHHTGDGTVFPKDTDFKELVRYYWDLHVNTNGWSDIGYNWLIDKNGVIYEGRGNSVLGAHFSCMSSNTTGIAVIGNFEIEEPSTEAINALQELIAWEATDKNIAITNVSYHTSSQLILDHLSGHRDGNPSNAANSCASGTVCPGANLYAILPDISSAVSQFSCYEESQPTLDCSNAVELTCGIPYSGENSTATSSVLYYGCNNWTETGPERVHTLSPEQDGVLRATISGFSGDLDVYILGSCNPSDCLGEVSSSSSIYTEAKAGETYYIVVDADDGSGSAYDLLVDCIDPQNQHDVSVSTIEVEPSEVKAGATIQVVTDLEYDGFSSAANLEDVSLSYYLTTQCNGLSSDILLETDAVNLGNDFSEINLAESLTIPTEINSGQYYIRIVADTENSLPELYENNNAACVEITINNALALTNFDFENQLDIFPNPTHDVISVASGSNFQVERMLLFNSSGQLVLEQKENKELNLQDFGAGLYLLKVFSKENHTAVFKVIKE